MSSDVLDYPDALAELSEEAVFEALVRRKLNISAAAKDLGVPSGPLRAIVIADPRYGKAAAEFLQHRQDMADSVIYDALTGDEPRSRLAAAFFVTRFGTAAAARGWITARPPEVDAFAAAEPREFIVRWGDYKPRKMETVSRDGRLIEVPSYDDGPAEPPQLVSPPAGDDARNVESEPPGPPMNFTQQAKNAFARPRGVSVDDPISEAQIPEVEPLAAQSTPEPPASPTLPLWPGATPPPPLIDDKYRWDPPARAQPRRPPAPEDGLALRPSSMRRPSRGGWR